MNRPKADTTKRSRSAMREIRRQQIFDATLSSIAKRGFADTTLATVAAEANISQASLIFHFKTKDALLEAALRHISEVYLKTWQETLAKAPADPLARIAALVGCDFQPKVCSRKMLAVWFSYWGEAKSRPRYLAICGDRDHLRNEAMVAECRALLEEIGRDPATAEDLAAVIDNLIDGSWQSLLLYDRAFDRKEALRLCFVQLKALFPERADELERLSGREAQAA